MPRAVELIETGSRMERAGGKENGALFNGDRVSVLQDGESSEDGQRWRLHDSVKVLNTIEPNTKTWSRWSILCYVELTTVGKRERETGEINSNTVFYLMQHIKI